MPIDKELTIINAFSASMLDFSKLPQRAVIFLEVGEDLAKTICQQADSIKSAVGHESTAKIFSNILETEVSFNRINLTLEQGKVYLLGQYSGPRLPEGATALPEGASITWITVQLL